MSEYTDNNFTSSDWGLIQDAIVDQISYIKNRQTSNCVYPIGTIERLEEMLGRVSTKYKQTRVS